MRSQEFVPCSSSRVTAIPPRSQRCVSPFTASTLSTLPPRELYLCQSVLDSVNYSPLFGLCWTNSEGQCW